MPPTSGAVMSLASALMPKPTISARISAPRFRASLFGFQHHHRGALADDHAFAVPGERPALVRRHHPHRLPALDGAKGQMQASAPPVTAGAPHRCAPSGRTRPIACVAEAQALTTANAGPRKPQCIETWLAGAFTISFGIVSGNTRGCCRHRAAGSCHRSWFDRRTRADDGGCSLGQFALENEARLRDGFRAATTANCDTRSRMRQLTIVKCFAGRIS